MIAMVGTGFPEKILTTAQVAFRNAETWSIVAQYGRLGGRLPHTEMPKVSCPVIDTTGVINRAHLDRIIHRYISPHGVSDVTALLASCEVMGAKIFYPGALQQANHTEQLAK